MPKFKEFGPEKGNGEKISGLGAVFRSFQPFYISNDSQNGENAKNKEFHIKQRFHGKRLLCHKYRVMVDGWGQFCDDLP